MRYFIVLSLAFFSLFACSKQNHKSGHAVPVVMANAALTKMPELINEYGSLVADQIADISPQIAGQISEILFQEGSFVKKDTPLIQLDPSLTQAKLRSDEADQKVQKAKYTRFLALAKKGMQSRQELDAQIATLAAAKANVAIDKIQLQYLRLAAPFDGMLGIRNVSVGDYVTVGQKVLSIIDQSNLKVQYAVSEKYLPKLKMGQTVKLTSDPFPGKTFEGKVVFVSPKVDENTRTITVQARIPNKNNALSPGLYVRISHILGYTDGAVVVPLNAIVGDIEGYFVYRVDKENVAHKVNIEVGTRFEKLVQVNKGLKMGDTIIIQGQQKVHDGSKVISLAKMMKQQKH